MKTKLLNYENCECINKVYNDFTQEIISVTDKVAPINERFLKQTQESFDGEIANEIKNHDKLFKKF